MRPVSPRPKRRRCRRRKPGTIIAGQAILWGCILACERVLNDATTPDGTLRACHAVAQALGVYKRLVETTELLTRIEALEAKLAHDPSDTARPGYPPASP